MDSEEEKISAFIGKLSFKTTESSLTRFLSQHGCKPISVRIITDYDSGKSKGFGYADFTNKSAFEKCLALDGEELDGFNIHCDSAKSSGGGGRGAGRSSFGGNSGGGRSSFGGGGGGRGGPQQPAGKRLKISNLSYNTSTDSLHDTFSNAVDVFVVMDRDTGKSRGFGFIEFESIGEATKMMKKFSGKNVDGREVRLEYAGERPQSGGNRGGFQGGRGGGGRGRGGGRPSFSPNPARKGAIQAYEGSKKKFGYSDYSD